MGLVFSFIGAGLQSVLFSLIMEFFVVTKMETSVVILIGVFLGGLSGGIYLLLELFLLSVAIGGLVAFILKHHYERKKNLSGNRAIPE